MVLPVAKMHGNNDETTPLYADSSVRIFPSCRLTTAVTCCCGVFMFMALRVNLSVAIVPMSKELHWSNVLQGYILGAFFYGYMTSQIIGGRLAEKFGAKYLFGGSVFWTSALNLVIPAAARSSPYLLITVLIVQGIPQGATVPTVNVLLAKWTHPKEHSTTSSFVYTGFPLGVFLSMLSSGFISRYLGWPWVFYIFGSIGCIWFLIYLCLVYECPAVHPRISTAEKVYITGATGLQWKNEVDMPWCSVLKSGAVWGMVTAHVSMTWGHYTFLTCLPKYLHDVLHFDIEVNGLLLSLPYAVELGVLLTAGVISDYLINGGHLSTTNTRKLFNTTGLVIPAFCLVAITFLGDARAPVMSLLVTAGGLEYLSVAGHFINMQDLSPKFAGTLMGISNTLAQVPGILAPAVVGWFTATESGIAEWRNVFLLTAGIYCFGALMFILLGSGEEQPWSEKSSSLNVQTIYEYHSNDSELQAEH